MFYRILFILCLGLMGSQVAQAECSIFLKCTPASSKYSDGIAWYDSLGALCAVTCARALNQMPEGSINFSCSAAADHCQLSYDYPIEYNCPGVPPGSRCPPSKFAHYDAGNNPDTPTPSCDTEGGEVAWIDNAYYCVKPAPLKPDVRECSAAGNPIILGTGQKALDETDFDDGEGLSLRRSYRTLVTGPTQRLDQQSIGNAVWSFSFNGEAMLEPVGGDKCKAFVTRGNGYTFEFNGGKPPGSSTCGLLGDEPQSGTLVDLFGRTLPFSAAVAYQAEGSNEVEYYNRKLRAVIDSNGRRIDYLWSTNTLTIRAASGKQLTISLDSTGKPLSFLDPAGNQTRYVYNSAGLLQSVIRPDGKSRDFLYEHSTFAWALTGIRDENGIRYSNYDYDGYGRAILSELAGGADQTRVNYGVLGYSSPSLTVQTPGGTSTVQLAVQYPNIIMPGGNSQYCPTCRSNAQNITYDGRGHPAEITDFANNQTRHQYDANGRLTQQIEAANSATPRTTSFAWHARWNKPTQIAQPNKITTYLYNGDLDQGSPLVCAPTTAQTYTLSGTSTPLPVLCKQIEQATTDQDGSLGFAAPPTGAARTTLYTWNADSKLSSIDGPLPGNTDRVSYTYRPSTDSGAPPAWRQGDLWKITNALGQVTEITKMHPNGYPLEIKDPNGNLTRTTYNWRGQVLSKVVNANTTLPETTTYVYAANGTLTSITQPNGLKTTYTYDNAQRLIGSSNSAGTKVLYTLDGLGNPLREETYNKAGKLVRRIDKQFDARSQVTQKSGVSQ